MNKNKQFQKTRRMKIKRLFCFLLPICIIAISYFTLNKPANRQSYHPSAKCNIKVDTNRKKWYLTLVNKQHPIEDNYDITLLKLSNGEQIDKRIYPSLQKMFDSARKEGIYPVVASGYRTKEEQKDIYNKKIAEYQKNGLSYDEAKKEAELWVAIPGTSEHQLGIAVDINADGINSSGTVVYKWLKDNAHLYGFINRYPSNKTQITGVSHEPWHYRYVGVEAATDIYNQGICLEEYLDTTIKDVEVK